MEARRNGFVGFPNVHQAGAAVSFAVLVVGFAFVQAPALPPGALRAALLALYAADAVLVAALDLYCTAVDPADAGAPDDDAAALYCGLCEKLVHHRSKHCRVCNKCVAGFDHHCMWLNTCVGTRNYKPFFALLCCTLALVSTQLAVSAYLLSRAWTEREALERDIANSQLLGQTDARWDAMVGIVVGFAALALVLCYVVGHLCFFHVILLSKGISTYDFILLKRKQAEEAAEAAPEASKRQQFCGFCRGSSAVAPAQAGADTPTSKKPRKVAIDPCALLRVRAQQAKEGRARGSDLRRLMTMSASDSTPSDTPRAVPASPDMRRNLLPPAPLAASESNVLATLADPSPHKPTHVQVDIHASHDFASGAPRPREPPLPRHGMPPRPGSELASRSRPDPDPFQGIVAPPPPPPPPRSDERGDQQM